MYGLALRGAVALPANVQAQRKSRQFNRDSTLRWPTRRESRFTHCKSPRRKAARCDIVITEGQATFAAVFATGPAIATVLGLAQLWKDGDSSGGSSFDVEAPEAKLGKQRNLMWVRYSIILTRSMHNCLHL